MSTDALAAAFASTRAVLVNVTPDQYDNATPCASWDVRALINHIVAGSHYFAATARAGEPPAGVEPPDFTEDDPLTAFDAGITASLEAFAAPDVGTRMITLPFGTMPGAAFMRIAAVDTFAHGWDLARATGQDSDLSPGLARELLAGTREALPESLRGPDGESPFGAIVKVSDSASEADQLAAFLGRQP
ncbi:MAG: TIGR03086 family metal-binding protein [Actinomycetota bacterium]|nr:TIGR03086 family metal-binding protein [Actinomycetota bacterium]